MAGPERPRWVNRMFSRKLCFSNDATASKDTPAKLASNPGASAAAFNGTSPGKVCVTRKPNRFASS